MPDGYLYRKLNLRIEKETAKTGFVSCARLNHVLEQMFSLDFTERNVVTQELRAAKVIEYNPECGWRLKTANITPVTAEFGHACHGCAKYPCEKAMAGEPLGDCYDFERRDEP